MGADVKYVDFARSFRVEDGEPFNLRYRATGIDATMIGGARPSILVHTGVAWVIASDRSGVLADFDGCDVPRGVSDVCAHFGDGCHADYKNGKWDVRTPSGNQKRGNDLSQYVEAADAALGCLGPQAQA